MIKVVIVENEEKHLADLLDQLKSFEEIQVVCVCASVKDGVEKISALKPQLVFLDVELNGGTCFDLLESLRPIHFEVIFTTAHVKYAIKAIKFSALDYLLKPYGPDKLKEAIESFRSKAAINHQKNYDVLLDNSKQPEIMQQIIGIPVVGGIDFIPVSEIISCQADNNYTHFYLKGKRKITASKTLKWVNELLDELPFFRVHQSYLINIKCMLSYRTEGDGGLVSLIENNEADVARLRKAQFLATLAELKIIHA